jgi:O-antigen ligase
VNSDLRTQWWRPETHAGRGHEPEISAVSETGFTDSAAPFWALMAFTFILLVAPQSFLPVLAPLRIALLAAALAVATYLFDRFIHRRPILRITREMWIALGLAGWAVVTVPLSYWPGGSVSFLIDVYFKTLAVFWLLTCVVNTVSRLRLTFWCLSLMAVPIAMSAVGNFLSGEFLRDGVSRIGGYDAPLTENPNDLALTLNLILPLSVALLFTTRSPAVRAALLALIGLDAIAIIATFSRAGFLTLAVTCATYLWALIKRQKHGWAFCAIVLALVALPLLPSSYIERLSTITDIEGDPTGSAQERWTDTLAAVKYVVHHPIVGAGVGMNALALNEKRGATWKEIHNVYLQYAVELGLPGLALFLLLLTGCIRGAHHAQRRATGAQAPEDLFYLAEGIRISLVAFAVAAFFHPSGYHFYFYYIAGLAVVAKTIGDADCADRPAPRAP